MIVTRVGAEVMRGEAPARIVLPATQAPRAKRTRGGATRKGDPPSEVTEADRALFERLRARRAELARARRVPAYVVAFDRTLIELATSKPRTLDALASIYGFGPSRVEQYGQSFLDVVGADADVA